MTATQTAALTLTQADRHELARERFQRIVSAYSADLYRYAFWLCRDPSLAEDLVQETFLRGWRALDSIRDEGSVKAWLLTILRREHARQFERHQPEFQDVDTASLPGPRGVDGSTEAFVVRRAVARLPEEYREPLLLQVLGGYRVEEIGEMLGLTRGAVMTRVFRARQKLRDALGINRPGVERNPTGHRQAEPVQAATPD